ncbi:hypothetical protein CH254_25135 [Rhodococcus sp. 06-412-2C]|uniref:hypothetical protein n=1 Tax=unclassified Rhodococcus (in: high G+C Gram-positive bacteria) TaxID=192944 RepID=UPI000B9B644A|nr:MULTISPECIES: hypothetical protein [unclassified Rhodococcus (in: high G+C Gram-positive bacteria)]OZC84140.1 hypothetical protein CH254_25135 [Rhodococcus sp. 06-412-2C]OZC94328.1 hypothetical protein CH279_23220 [Rhodococcus sp. 06-412-2B]
MKFQSLPNYGAVHATTFAIVRMKTIEAFRRRGVTVHRVDATTVAAGSGPHFPLENLFARCSGASRSAWDSIIDGHVDVMIEMMREADPTFITSLSDDEFHSRLRERIVAPSALEAMAEYDYSVPLLDAPGAPRRVLNLSSPNRALTLADRHLVGRDMNAAWAAGRRNTAAMKFEDGRILSRNSIDIEVLSGDSIYLASKVADMTTLISTHLGECLYGVLFVVPNAYEFVFHRPRNADMTLAAAAELAELADMFGRDTPSPLSSSVFFWRDGKYCDVSHDPAGIFASTLTELRACAA